MTGRTIFDGRVRVDYHQLWVMSDEIDVDYLAAFQGQANGLLGAMTPGLLVLMTGTAVGDVGLRVVLHGVEPPVGDEWEDVAEAAFTPTRSDVAVVAPTWEPGLRFELDPAGYRARWSARGMDAAYDLVVEPHEPLVDVFELALWPAPPAPDAVLRRGSDRGRGLHLEWTAEGRAERELLAWGDTPLIPELVGRPHASRLAQVDRSLAERLAGAAPEDLRRLAVWAIRNGCARYGLDRLPRVAAGIDALATGHPLPPEFTDWNTVSAHVQADVGPVGDVGVLLRMVDFPPDPLDAALIEMVHLADPFDPDRRRDLLTEARAVLG